MRNDLASALRLFVSGQSNVDELEDWLVGHLQGVLESKDEVAIDAVNQMDTGLIQLSEGLASFGDVEKLARDLLDFLRSARLEFVSEGFANQVSAGGENVGFSFHFEEHGPVRDHHLEVNLA